MTTRVINDPAALGWEFDPDTGRWTWGGGGSSSGGGGGTGGIGEAPLDGSQYGRQSGGWTPITGGGSGGDLYGHWNLQADGGQPHEVVSKSYVNFEGTGGISVTRSGGYITIDGSGISGGGSGTGGDNYQYWRYQIDGSNTTNVMTMNTVNFRAGSNVTLTKVSDGIEISATGGSGGNVDLTGYATETWVSSNYQVKGNYLTSSSLNGYATQTWVGQNYQPKGNYLTGFTESDPVFKASPAGTITQTMINNWNNAGGGSTPTLQQVTDAGATTNKSMTAPNFHCATDGYTLGGTTSGGARIIVSGGWSFTASNSGLLVGFSNAGDITAQGDVTAFSDVRLKEDIKTLDGSKVYDMRGVSFTKDGRQGSGVIAQELLEVAPELVHEDGEYLSVAYGNLVGYLIEAVKDLKAEVEELKNGSR